MGGPENANDQKEVVLHRLRIGLGKLSLKKWESIIRLVTRFTEVRVMIGVGAWGFEGRPIEGHVVFSGTRPARNQVLRNRKALAMTETLLKLMAAAASIGLSKALIPKNGTRIPAATGTPIAL